MTCSYSEHQFVHVGRGQYVLLLYIVCMPVNPVLADRSTKNKIK